MSSEFHVQWKKIGKYRNRRSTIEASGLSRLEAPLREAAEPYLGEKAKTMTVTFEEESGKGQLDYGLTGEFTVTPL